MHKPRILAEFLLPGVPAAGSPPSMLARAAKQDNDWIINLPRAKEVFLIRRATG
jgi:hypothetical protein